MNKRYVCSGIGAFASLLMYAQQPLQDSVGLQQLDEVVVSDSRFELKREYSGKTIIRIGEAELARNQGRSVAELLNTKSGLEIAGSRGRQGEVLGVFGRGGRGRQVLVLIDGIRVSDPSSSSQEYDLRLLSLNDLESIEIIKGASSTLYGTNAATAVISITTKHARDSRFNLTAESSLGTNQTADRQDYSLAEFNHSARIGGKLGDFEYSAGISQAFSEHLSSLVTDANEEDPFSSYAANLRLGYKFSEKLRFRVFANKTRIRTDYDESFGFVDAPYQYLTEQQRAGASLEASYNHGEVIINSAYSQFDSENISSFPGTFLGSNQVLDAYNKYTFNEFLYTLAGISYNKEKTAFAEARNFTIVDPYVNLVYVSDFGLNLNTGARLNTHSEYGNQWVYNLNPSFSLTTTEGYLKLLGSWATSYITPSLTQLFGEFGANPELAPETNRTLETGLEWMQYKHWRASILYFNRKEENYVFFDSSNFLYRNAPGILSAKGIEIETEWNPSERIVWQANYTFTKRKGDNAIRIPKHKLNAELGFRLQKDTYVSLQYAFTGTRLDTDFNSFMDVRLEPFSLIHIYLSQELMDGSLKIFANIENLFNERYTEILGFTTRGRNLKIGCRLQL